MDFTDLLTSILIIAASLLCIALIFYLWKITRAIKAIQNNLDDISSRLNPLITTVYEVTQKLSGLTEEAKGQLDVSRNVVDNVKNKVNSVLDLVENIKSKVEGPLITLANNIRAISNGINTFLEHFKR